MNDRITITCKNNEVIEIEVDELTNLRVTQQEKETEIRITRESTTVPSSFEFVSAYQRAKQLGVEKCQYSPGGGAALIELSGDALLRHRFSAINPTSYKVSAATFSFIYVEELSIIFMSEDFRRD